MHMLTLLAMAIILATGQKTKSSKRVTNGNEIFETEYPFFVQLKIIDKQLETRRFIATRVCGGSLIQIDWVLTAASCFYDLRDKLEELSKRKDLIVYAGTIYRFKNGENGIKNWIQSVEMHPEYYEEVTDDGVVIKMKNDIALAKLKKKYKTTDYIAPAYLPATTKNCIMGTVIGIGLVNRYDDEEFPGSVLAIWRVPVKNRAQLRTHVPVPMVDTIFYTEEQWKDGHAMPGDTGGPFRCSGGFRIPIIYGVNSRVSDSLDGGNFHVGYYETVYKHMDFIKGLVPDVQLYDINPSSP